MIYQKKISLYFFFGIYISLLLLSFISLSNPIKKNVNSKNQTLKNKIPNILFKTGPFNVKQIPIQIKKAISQSSRLLNCQVLYFDDQQSRILIQNNFPKKILEAYDLLIPKAFKSDLWRYCVIYLYGGIYGDLSQTILQRIDNDIYQYDMVLVKDRPNCYLDHNIQISFMASKPKNNFIKFVINQITLKVLKRDKGKCRFDLTGPVAFGKLFCYFFKTNKLYPGVNIYLGLDNKKYLINIPFQEIGSFISSINNRNNHIIKTKTKNHFKLLHKNYKQHYRYQWENNLVFKY